MTEEEMQQKIADMEAANAAALHKANQEAKSLRDRLKGVSPKALAVYDRLKTDLGVDDVDETALEELLSARAGKLTTDDQLKALTRKLEAEQKKAQEASQRAEGLDRKQRESERDSKILAALGKVGISSQAMAKAVKLVASDSAFEDGVWTFEGADLDTYAAKFAKENPYMVGNPVRGGGGDSGQASVQGVTGDFISEEDYLRLTPDQKRDPKIHKLAKESMMRWKK